MDASSSQPKRRRLKIDRRDGATYFVLIGIFFVTVQGADVLRFLLPHTEIASPLAEFLVLLAAFLWLGVMILLARYAKLLHRILMYLLFIPFIGAFFYFFATRGSSDGIGYKLLISINGLFYLTIAPEFWLEYKLDKQAATTAWNYKPWLRFLIVIFGLIVVWTSAHWMVYPSRYRLCRDVAEYIPLQECLALENNLAVMKRAFPLGKVTSEQVKAALGDYLEYEGRVTNTTDLYQTYRLNITPMITWNDRSDHFLFLYHSNGVLKSIPDGDY